MDSIAKARKLAAIQSGLPVEDGPSAPGTHVLAQLDGLANHIGQRLEQAHREGLLPTQEHSRTYAALAEAKNHLADANSMHERKLYGGASEALKPAAAKIQEAAGKLLDSLDPEHPIAQDFLINEAYMGLADRHHNSYAAAVTKERNNGR